MSSTQIEVTATQSKGPASPSKFSVQYANQCHTLPPGLLSRQRSMLHYLRQRALVERSRRESLEEWIAREEMKLKKDFPKQFQREAAHLLVLEAARFQHDHRRRMEPTMVKGIRQDIDVLMKVEPHNLYEHTKISIAKLRLFVLAE